MKCMLTMLCISVLIPLPIGAQENATWLNLLHNERLKAEALPDRPISGSPTYRYVTGIWTPESKDSSKGLVFPQQVRIDCHNYGTDDRACVEISVTLGATNELVSLQDIGTSDYDIDHWDSDGLIASYGGEEPDRCQRHVLTMDFKTGAVSVSDIPTHRKGCEAFMETDCYKLVRGFYYVDTSPKNDMDKPLPKQ